jgi:ribosomal protein S18 acetylase RimI-like enzyme
MLDKSLPYLNVIMRRPAAPPPPMPPLPPGYRLTGYEMNGDAAWGRVESSVGEFESPDQGRSYFRQHYLLNLPEVLRRVIFVVGPDQAVVGTVTAWWDYTGVRRDAALHWLGVLPAHQGQGIGSALVAACLERLWEVEGNTPVWLHTQTWSHTAIGIYLRAGFEIVRDRFAGGRNDYDEALQVLRQVRPGYFSQR